MGLQKNISSILTMTNVFSFANETVWIFESEKILSLGSFLNLHRMNTLRIQIGPIEHDNCSKFDSQDLVRMNRMFHE